MRSPWRCWTPCLSSSKASQMVGNHVPSMLNQNLLVALIFFTTSNLGLAALFNLIQVHWIRFPSPWFICILAQTPWLTAGLSIDAPALCFMTLDCHDHSKVKHSCRDGAAHDYPILQCEKNLAFSSEIIVNWSIFFESSYLGIKTLSEDLHSCSTFHLLQMTIYDLLESLE